MPERRRIYVGATFSRYLEARSVMDALTTVGHEITHDWTRTDAFGDDGHPLPETAGGYDLPATEQAAHALDDLEAVKRADLSGAGPVTEQTQSTYVEEAVTVTLDREEAEQVEKVLGEVLGSCRDNPAEECTRAFQNHGRCVCRIDRRVMNKLRAALTDSTESGEER